MVGRARICSRCVASRSAMGPASHGTSRVIDASPLRMGLGVIWSAVVHQSKRVASSNGGGQVMRSQERVSCHICLEKGQLIIKWCMVSGPDHTTHTEDGVAGAASQACPWSSSCLSRIHPGRCTKHIEELPTTVTTPKAASFRWQQG